MIFICYNDFEKFEITILQFEKNRYFKLKNLFLLIQKKMSLQILL